MENNTYTERQLRQKSTDELVDIVIGLQDDLESARGGMEKSQRKNNELQETLERYRAEMEDLGRENDRLYDHNRCLAAAGKKTKTEYALEFELTGMRAKEKYLEEKIRLMQEHISELMEYV